MKKHVPIQEVWSFESEYCRNPRAWLNQGINLRYSAEALFLYDSQLLKQVSPEKTKAPLPSFQSANVERMLMGFSLEALAKAIIVQDPGKEPEAIKAWRARMMTPEAGVAMKRRKRIETINAIVKNRGMRRMMLRGMAKIRCCVLLQALANNLMQAHRLRSMTAPA
jgi:hypothetical protein